MRQGERHQGFGRTRGSLVAAGCALLVLAVGANAALGARSADARTASLCSVSKSVAANIAGSTDTKNIAGSPTKLKAFWGKIQSAEPTILGAASGSMKTHLTHVFAFVNTVIGDLNKVNWNYTALLPQEQTLENKAAQVAPDLKVVKTYYTKTCNLKV
jgi:hypothetical protein